MSGFQHADIEWQLEEQFGLKGLDKIYQNLSPSELIEHAVKNGEGKLSLTGPLVVYTGKATGRSPEAKYIVRDATTEGKIDFGTVNQPYESAKFANLYVRVAESLTGKSVYVQDLFAGADPNYRLAVRIVTANAWQSLFAQNMFVRPERKDMNAGFHPEFTLLHVPSFHADPTIDSTNNERFVMLDFGRQKGLIGGTEYGGEIKKSMFTVMNKTLPEKGVLPMHASANVGPDGSVTVFFGLSGTGKTTLSADTSCELIGDDEHGWSDKGVFNFEGGCYAKVIRLQPENEPQIYAATHRYGTILENVVMNPNSRRVDLGDDKFTENTRSCYPIHFIDNYQPYGMGRHPNNIIMLTCDAFGVLPPIARLSTDQAMYHFLSGYTAKVAGTERDVKEPKATFSTCFGAPFLPLYPEVYARMLGEKVSQHGVNCWLINTGWTGGAYGEGRRIPLEISRVLVKAVLSGELLKTQYRTDRFGLSVPTHVENVPESLLRPARQWKDTEAYDDAARNLIDRFGKNFEQYKSRVSPKIAEARLGG